MAKSRTRQGLTFTGMPALGNTPENRVQRTCNNERCELILTHCGLPEKSDRCARLLAHDMIEHEMHVFDLTLKVAQGGIT